MKSVPQQSSSSLGNAAANSLGASASRAFCPIVATTSHYVLHSPPQGVSLPVDPASVSSSASEAADTSAHCEASLALQQARDEYAKVQRAYDRATTLCRTQEINRIWPALYEAKKRLLAAELEAC